MRSFHISLLILMLGLTLSTASHAGDVALAEKLFREGVELLDAGQHAAACDKFAASMEADPSGGTALNFGRCNELQGKTASAWAAFERAAGLFAAAGDAEREGFAREQLARLASTLATLTVRAPEIAGLEVIRDGEPLPAAALDTSVPVDPGDHTVEASAPGHEPWSLTVTVAAGDAKEVLVPQLTELTSTQAPEQPEEGDATLDEGGPNAVLVTGITLMGVGAVAAIVGGVLGGMVLGDAAEAEDLCGGDASCDFSPEGRAGKQLAADAEGMALGSTLLIGIGAGTAIVGAILTIVGAGSGEESGQPAAQWLPLLGPGELGVQLNARF